MDTYVEWLVKRKNGSSVTLLRILLMIVAVLVGIAAFLLLTRIAPMFGILALVLCIWGGWTLNRKFSLEFEYILTNFDLDVDEIIAQRKRKRLVSFKITGIQQFGRYDEAHRHQVENVHEQKRIDASTHVNGETYYTVFNNKKYGRTLLLFSPDERILKSRPHGQPAGHRVIAGVGVDLLELARMHRLLAHHQNLSRLFGPRELVLLAQKNSVATFAAHFCAKEAFSKALGTGVCGFSMAEVEVLRDKAGKPFFSLSGRAAQKAQGLVFSLSLTHDRERAAAFVVAEKEEQT